MKRIFLAATAALVLAACNQKESYEIGASDAYAKVLSSAFAEGVSPLPSGIAGSDVGVRFQSIPTDRTAYWVFSKAGKELGRINVAVEGDDASSTVSYSYAQGEGAAEFSKVSQQVKQHMPILVAEAVDSKIENRPFDRTLKMTADNMTATALIGNMMMDASAAMDEAVKKGEARRKESDANALVSQAGSTKPITDLSKY